MLMQHNRAQQFLRNLTTLLNVVKPYAGNHLNVGGCSQEVVPYKRSYHIGSRLPTLISRLMYVWRHSSLLVSVPDSRSSGAGLSPSWGHCVVFLTVPLSTKVYKLVLAN